MLAALLFLYGVIFCFRQKSAQGESSIKQPGPASRVSTSKPHQNVCVLAHRARCRQKSTPCAAATCCFETPCNRSHTQHHHEFAGNGDSRSKKVPPVLRQNSPASGRKGDRLRWKEPADDFVENSQDVHQNSVVRFIPKAKVFMANPEDGRYNKSRRSFSLVSKAEILLTKYIIRGRCRYESKTELSRFFIPQYFQQ